MNQNNENQDKPALGFRDWIAVTVVVVSILCLTIVAAVGLVTSDKTSETAQMIFSALLPLLGTWVGTVLAFYFSKENYEIAAKFAKDTLASTIERKLHPIPVTDAMIPGHRIKAHVLGPNEKIDDIKLITLRDEMQNAGFRRIPILSPERHFLAVVHHESLVSFLLDAASDATTRQSLKEKRNKEQIDSITIGDARVVRESLVSMFETLVTFVPQSFSMAQVKNALEATARCQDAFVTQTGGRKEPVLGWVTNNEIMERLRG